MALPLPNPLAAGGDVTAGLNAIADLFKKNLENKYYPTKTMAEANSKNTYANLMGPQFLAKLAGNENILANNSDTQNKGIVNKLFSAGMGGGSGQQSAQNNSQPEDDNGILGWAVKALKSKLGGGNNGGNTGNTGNAMQAPSPVPSASTQQNQNQQGNPFGQLPANDQQSINNLQPGQSYTIPEAPANKLGEEPSFSENVGKYKGIVEEGKEAGQIRAKDIKDLNDSVFNGETNQTTLDELSDIVSSPEFKQIRQVPLAGRHELAYYAKEGTPEQQNMVGRYSVLTGNIIKDSAKDFKGQFRQGEQQLLTNMKPSPSDTVDSAIGKTEQLSILNKLLTERSRLTSSLMNKYHINKLDASEAADKQLNGEAIRDQIHAKLNPTVTIRNKKTGETKTISMEEAKKLGVPNV